MAEQTPDNASAQPRPARTLARMAESQPARMPARAANMQRAAFGAPVQTLARPMPQRPAKPSTCARQGAARPRRGQPRSTRPWRTAKAKSCLSPSSSSASPSRSTSQPRVRPAGSDMETIKVRPNQDQSIATELDQFGSELKGQSCKIGSPNQIRKTPNRLLKIRYDKDETQQQIRRQTKWIWRPKNQATEGQEISLIPKQLAPNKSATFSQQQDGIRMESFSNSKCHATRKEPCNRPLNSSSKSRPHQQPNSSKIGQVWKPKIGSTKGDKSSPNQAMTSTNLAVSQLQVSSQQIKEIKIDFQPTTHQDKDGKSATKAAGNPIIQGVQLNKETCRFRPASSLAKQEIPATKSARIQPKEGTRQGQNSKESHGTRIQLLDHGEKSMKSASTPQIFSLHRQQLQGIKSAEKKRNPAEHGF